MYSTIYSILMDSPPLKYFETEAKTVYFQGDLVHGNHSDMIQVLHIDVQSKALKSLVYLTLHLSAPHASEMSSCQFALEFLAWVIHHRAWRAPSSLWSSKA